MPWPLRGASAVLCLGVLVSVAAAGLCLPLLLGRRLVVGAVAASFPICFGSVLLGSGSPRGLWHCGLALAEPGSPVGTAGHVFVGARSGVRLGAAAAVVAGGLLLPAGGAAWRGTGAAVVVRPLLGFGRSGVVVRPGCWLGCGG